MKLLAGSGRSGTTWVQDALAAANDLRPVFEPLHPAVSTVGARYAYAALQPHVGHPELQEFLTAACDGKRHALWMKYRGRPDRLFPSLPETLSQAAARQLYRRWRKFLRDVPALLPAGRRALPLVKCIRANLMLDWLARWLECRTVLLVRHPGAVIESQYRLGGVWDPEPVLERYRADTELHAKTDGRYRTLLTRRFSTIEALAVNWVIENQWAMEHAGICNVTVVHYEHLRAEPQREWPRICRGLDLRVVPGEALRDRPSQQSSKTGADSRSGARWMLALSQSDLDAIQGILDATGFDAYSMREPEPLPASARRTHVPENVS